MSSSALNNLWLIFCAALVFLQQIGFLCLESGLTRQKNNINVAAKNLLDAGIVFLCFCIIGFWFAFGDSHRGLIGTPRIMTVDTPEDVNLMVFMIYQGMFCCAAVTIISGAVSERMRFTAYATIAVFTALCIYPIFVHWAWNDGGWLKAIGFFDYAGATVVHSVAGWIALAAILIIGPRKDRFNADGTVNEIPASNLATAVQGAGLLWVGWIGFNGGSSGELDHVGIRSVIYTLIAGSAGLTAMYVWQIIRRQPISIPTAINALLAALVAITACAGQVNLAEALLIGIAGSFGSAWVSQMLLRFQLDDAVGAIPVHLGGGIVGTLAAGLIASEVTSLSIQVLGIFMAFTWAFIPSLIFFLFVNKLHPMRVSEQAEAIGLNTSEHNARSDMLDLLTSIETQNRNGDFFQPLHEEPFTESGLIAKRINSLIQHIHLDRQRLDELHQKALSASQAKADFLNNMSHELRTPMNAILGFAQLLQLRRNGMTASHLELVEKISDASNALLKILNDVLEISAMEAGQLEVKNEPFELAPFTQGVEAMFEAAFAEKRLNFLAPALPATIAAQYDGDAGRIGQILINLLDNALKYTERGHVEWLIECVQQENQVDRFKFHIRDTGMGIEKQVAEQIFEPFSQADNSASRRFDGTGLGLTICQRLAESMEGEISVTSELGEGSCFTLELPLTRIDAA